MFRPIYKPRTRALEYCEYAVNIYDSCPHNCVYCYARDMSVRFGKPWPVIPSPRLGVVDAVRSQLSHGKITGKKIMLCFTCDPYPIGHDSVTTREIIKAIKESGNYVQILTKGYETAQRDFDLLDAGDSFGVTISGDRGEWEPIAKDLSLRAWRVINIAAAHSRGIKTWVSCEPVLEPEAIYGSIKSMSELVDLWRIGKLNHCKSDIDWYVFGHEVEGLCKSLNVNYYIKEDLRKEMEVKWK